jgi:hypothetical protein
MHFSFATQPFDVRSELPLIGTNGAPERFIIGKDSAEAEGKYGGVFKAVTDHACVIDGGLLIEIFFWIVFGDDNGEITGWIKEDLISGDSCNCLHWNRFTVTGEFRKCLFLADAVGVPRHRGPLHRAGDESQSLSFECKASETCLLI